MILKGNTTIIRFVQTGLSERRMRKKKLVRTLVREQASPEDFETLFKYQGEHKMWEAEIARADDFERNSDSFFVNWVDSIKVRRQLKFWIKGNITSTAKLVHSLVPDEIYVPHSA